MTDVIPDAWRRKSILDTYGYTEYEDIANLWILNSTERNSATVEPLYSQAVVDQLRSELNDLKAAIGAAQVDSETFKIIIRHYLKTSDYDRLAAANARVQEAIDSDFPHQHIYKEAIHAYADGYETGWVNAMVHCRQALFADNTEFNQENDQ